ncbi:hypothetical protein G7Y89_g8192 [Cudoniella acicularis]|uniref:Uncharacterized protein n=1 Tax=Cudoniella acicularis TaxID=354080 RepID=A0A8H4RJT9_9HELO|nr:hypothetical protein G7Y89_g8192 [Cudoniella acicularis]
MELDRRQPSHQDTPKKPMSILLETLPGEIRNAIFEMCIVAALKQPNTSKTSSLVSTEIPKTRNVTVSIFPRWHDPIFMRTEGLGPLPLLFVNKQIYKELSYLIYSNLDQVSIGGYPLNFPNENPNHRWALVYSRLEKLPGVLKRTRKVKVSMPYFHVNLHRGYWISLRLPPPKISTKNINPWKVVPGLQAFLSTFEALTDLEIRVTVEDRPPPDFEGLLPIYDMCGQRTAVVLGDPLGRWNPSVGTWNVAWENCLRKTGRL